MKFLRGAVAVLVGYVIFAVSAVLLFQLTGRNSHAPQSVGFMSITVVYGMAFAALGGWITARIAATRPMLHASILSVLIALGAAISLIASPTRDASWSQWAALVAMAPSTLLGGRIAARARQTP